jgi:hypothetical protein
MLVVSRVYPASLGWLASMPVTNYDLIITCHQIFHEMVVEMARGLPPYVPGFSMSALIRRDGGAAT